MIQHRQNSLNNISIPEAVTKIEERAFFGTNLKTVYIPDMVTSVSDQAFGECGSLKEASIPENAQIAENAFDANVKQTVRQREVNSV